MKEYYMNRYKKGILNIFPMEKEWNGRWVEYNEVEPLEKTIKELRQANNKLDLQIDDLNDEIDTLRKYATNLIKWNGVAIFIIVSLIAVIIGLLQQ